MCSGVRAQDSGSNLSLSISYTRDVQPIFTETCVACHACYDAACQLNLGSAEGALRGASKVQVYNGRRSEAEAPPRLYYDAPSVNETLQITQWEDMLNARGAKEGLVARWLYEHLFLAHIYFEGGEPGHFFQWVRSRTPSGQPVDLINTRRPNDDPGTDVYYRLWPVQGVIVHKTHITYPMSPEQNGAGQRAVLQR